MKMTVLGTLVGAGLVMAVVGVLPDRGEVFAQRPAPQWSNAPGAELIVVSETANQSYQQLTVIDPKLQAMSVYHIDLADGRITLRSVRNFHWDLQMLEHNAVSPLPQDLQALIQRR